MNIPKEMFDKCLGISEWAILVGCRGSIAHGMYIPNTDPYSLDDKDVMAVCVPPIDYYFGLRRYGSRGTKEVKHQEWDAVVYEIRKYISLLASANPNVLSLLWLGDDYYIKRTDAGNLLIENRDLFATKKAYKSFTGYAHGQLHKMTHQAYEGYMGQRRKELVEKFGYDTKNAAHLVRLLRMGIEFLRDGNLNVLRQDAAQLLEIKRGEWKLSRIQSEATRLFKEAEKALSLSTLPVEPDMDAINALAIRIISEHLGYNLN